MTPIEITENNPGKLENCTVNPKQNGFHSPADFLKTFSSKLRPFSTDENNRTQTKVLLLAHADDGVIWGKLNAAENGNPNLELAPDSVPLAWETLQTLRLFCSSGELLLWQSDFQWLARWIVDTATSEATWCESYDEYHLLWGTRCVASHDGFSTLEHGDEGLRHSVPLDGIRSDTNTNNLSKPVAIKVRHYLSPSGPATVVASRLADLVQLP